MNARPVRSLCAKAEWMRAVFMGPDSSGSVVDLSRTILHIEEKEDVVGLPARGAVIGVPFVFSACIRVLVWTMDPLVIEKMIEQGRDGYEARLAAGQAWLKRGEVDRALVHLERACETVPDRSMAWQELGRARLASGDQDGARMAWEQGIAVAETNGDKLAEKFMTVWLRR
ncbi:MAG: hypothetical protein LAT56_00575, partial [Wenzhouxiangella sp.]|nr:hypothetical protein [Wenzhouxiangella sp.]